MLQVLLKIRRAYGPGRVRTSAFVISILFPPSISPPGAPNHVWNPPVRDGRGIFGPLFRFFFPSWFLIICWSHFCPIWVPKWLPKSTQNRSKIDPEFDLIFDPILERLKCRNKSVLGPPNPQNRWFRISETMIFTFCKNPSFYRFWTTLGSIWGGFGTPK